jgi:hypothetical protein
VTVLPFLFNTGLRGMTTFSRGLAPLMMENGAFFFSSAAAILAGKKLCFDFRLVPQIPNKEGAGLVTFCRVKPARSALEDRVGHPLLMPCEWTKGTCPPWESKVL